MKFKNLLLGLFLAITGCFLGAQHANAAGGLGLSPSEVQATILQGDQAIINFTISREFFETEEIFKVVAENPSNLSFPDGQTITLAPGEQSKTFNLQIDTAGLLLEEENLRQIYVQPDHAVADPSGLMIFYGVGVNVHWQAVDINGFADYLQTGGAITFSNTSLSPDVVAGGKFNVKFSVINGSLDLIKYLTYRVDYLDAEGQVMDSVTVQSDGELAPYGDQAFTAKFRASDAGVATIRLIADYHGTIVTQKDLPLNIRPKGLHEYSIMLTQLGTVIAVLLILSIARKKKLSQLP
jgi:hypothetical protein